MNQLILPARLSKVRKLYFLRFWFSLAVMVMMSVSVGWGQVSITSTGTAFTQNFDDMGSSSTATLPSGFKIGTDWSSGTSATTQAYGTTGTGVVTGTSGGGIVNWANGVTASATDRALGFLTSSGYTSPRSIIYAFTNNTGSTVTSLTILWDYEKYRSGSRQIDWTFFHGSTSTASTAATSGDQSYAADANNTVISNPPLSTSKSVTLTDLSISNGTTYYLRWTYTGLGGSTNSQGLGIDNFSLTATSTSVTTPTTQAYNLTFSSIGQTGLTANWTNGDGAKRVVIMNTSNSFTAPTDGTDPTASTSYSGSGEQVVYNGSGNSVAVTGLSASTTYWFRVYEYNGSGATTKYLTSTGTNNPNSQATTAPAPLITVSTSSLTGFTYVQGSGPSTTQTFTVSGSNLSNNISIEASTNYEISESQNSGYASPITLTQSGGTVNSTTIYVRLKGGLSAGNYNSEIINITSSGADAKTVTCSGNVTSPPSYYRSKQTGSWSSASNWEISQNNVDWSDALTAPDSDENTITIRNGHTITVNSNVTLDEVVIENGGVLQYSSGTLTVNNGVGNDIKVESGGVFHLAFTSTNPSFSSGSTVEIQNGGILRLSVTGLTGASGVHVSNYVYGHNSILEYTSTSTFSASGVTFFPNVDANTIPIFRITALTSSPGGASNTVINGKIETNSSFTWGGAGTKTFRNGIIGSGNMSQGTTGKWIITSTNSEIGGSGVLTLGVNGLEIGSEAEVTVTNNKTINDGVIVINGDLNVEKGKQLTVSGNITNNGNLTLQSDASGTATLVNTGTISGSGTYTVQQHLTSGRNWYISSPVSGAQSSIFTTNVNNKLWERDAQNNQWDQITATDVTLTPMKGFVVNMQSSGVVSFTGGSLNTGNQNVVLSSFPATSGKFNLVGNPYPSHITWNNTLATAANTLTTIWYRTHVVPEEPALPYHAFHTFNATGNIGIPETVTGLIAPMQAFWVRVSDSGDPGTLSLTNTSRSHAATNPLKIPAIVNPLIRLVVSNGTNSDEAVIYFNGNASDSYDAYDSPKMFNNNVAVPEIYTRAGNEQLVINGMSQYFAGLQLPLGFYAGQTNSFSIRASQLRNISADMLVVLKDKQLNTEFDLTAGEAYSFTSEATNTEDRFVVMFKSASGTTAVDNALAGNMFVSSANGKLMLQLNTEISNASVTIYNATGQSMHSQAVVSPTTVLSKTLEAGVYVVKVVNGGRTAVLRTIVN